MGKSSIIDMYRLSYCTRKVNMESSNIIMIHVFKCSKLETFPPCWTLFVSKYFIMWFPTKNPKQSTFIDVNSSRVKYTHFYDIMKFLIEICKFQFFIRWMFFLHYLYDVLGSVPKIWKKIENISLDQDVYTSNIT